MEATYDKLKETRNKTLSYNVTRAYPFGESAKWVIIGVFLLFLIPITTFNVAANGWDLQVGYTSNPNDTEAERHWFQSNVFTWGDDRLNAKCQRVELRVGDQFLTSNLGLTYTITGVSVIKDLSRLPQQYSSLSYKNNVLQNCTVNAVNMVLTSRDISSGVPFSDSGTPWWSWGTEIHAVGNCSVPTSDGMYGISFTYQWGDPGLAVNNATSQASLWWGSRVMTAYNYGLSYVLAGELANEGQRQDPPVYTYGALNYGLDGNTSMRGVSPFNLSSFWFISSDGGISNDGTNSPANGTRYNNPSWGLSTAATEGLFIAKALSSLVQADLGNNQTANMFLDAASLQYALAPTDDFNRIHRGPLNLTTNQFDFCKINGLVPPDSMGIDGLGCVPLYKAYDLVANQTGPLGTLPATILAQYICSVPTPKSIPTVILFVVLADYVLIQGLWATFKFFADMWVAKKVTNPTYCDGCSRSTGLESRYESELGPQKYVAASSRQSLIEEDDELSLEMHSPLGRA